MEVFSVGRRFCLFFAFPNTPTNHAVHLRSYVPSLHPRYLQLRLFAQRGTELQTEPGPEGAQLQQAVLFTRGQRHPRLRQRELQGHPGPRKPSATLCCQAESREIAPKTLLPALDPTWRPLPTREAGTGSEDLECPSSLLLLEPCSRARSGPAPAEKSGHVGEEKLWSVTSSWTSLCTGGSPNPHDLGAPWLLAHPLAPGWSSVNATS